MTRRTRKNAAADVLSSSSGDEAHPLPEAGLPVSPEQLATIVGSSPDGERVAAALIVATTSTGSAPRPGSKLGIVVGLLGEPEGASLARLVKVTGWLPHTTRAALTGLRKRGYAVMSSKAPDADGRSVSVYRIATAQLSS